MPAEYNMRRHAGTIHALLRLYEVTGESQWLDVGRLAAERLAREVASCRVGDEDSSCLVDAGYVTLGANAMAIVAWTGVAGLSGEQEYLQLARSLGEWLRRTQGSDGRFTIHRQRHADAVVEDFTSSYYPGQAVAALTRLAAADPAGGWLDDALRGARYLIEHRDERVHDSWLLDALDRLELQAPDPSFPEHAARIASDIVMAQRRVPGDPARVDLIGGYKGVRSSTSAALRGEGLAAARRLALRAGRLTEAADMLEAMTLGLGFQLRHRLHPGAAMFLPEPQRVVGAFYRSPDALEIRIDCVQHNILALLALYENLSPSDGS